MDEVTAMKRERYMSKAELLNFLKLLALAGEAEEALKYCDDKNWRRKLKTTITYIDNITAERLALLDDAQKATIERRIKHNKVVFYTSDQRRMNQKNDGKPEEEVTISTDDLFDLVDMSMLSCMKCSQGDLCKTCEIRKMYHTLGVIPIRTNPAEGECEFRADNEVKAVTPQHRKMVVRM